MAADRRGPERRDPRGRRATASDELLRQAWSELGASPEDRDHGESASEAMAAAAMSGLGQRPVDPEGTEPDAVRPRSAEEIAQTLRSEVGAAAPSTRSREPERRSAAGEPRPRRVASHSPGAPPAPPRPRPRQQPPPPPPQQPRPMETGPRRRSTRGVGWLIFAAVWALFSLLGGVFERISTDDDGGVDIPVTQAPATLAPDVVAQDISTVAPGECIFGPQFGHLADTVYTVPCDKPHLYELYATVELGAEPAVYPGNETVFNAARTACAGPFADYVGEPATQSSWQYTFVAPTEDSWNSSNDRTARCLLYLRDDRGGPDLSEGSARGRGGITS